MIKITKKYYIDSDKHSYMLVKKVKAINKETKEEYITFRTLGYYSTVSSALTSLVRMYHKNLTKEREMTLSEAICEFKKAEELILKSANNTII